MSVAMMAPPNRPTTFCEVTPFGAGSPGSTLPPRSTIPPPTTTKAIATETPPPRASGGSWIRRGSG